MLLKFQRTTKKNKLRVFKEAKTQTERNIHNLFGRITRREKLIDVATTGNMFEQKDRGRRKKVLDSFLSCHGRVSAHELI